MNVYQKILASFFVVLIVVVVGFLSPEALIGLAPISLLAIRKIWMVHTTA